VKQNRDIVRHKLEKIKTLEQKLELQEGLPHLYGFPWYPWAREFFESQHKYNFLCAANQISKSSTQIRKAIHWATEQSLWPKLWKSKPLQFWYLYPTAEVATVEFEKKWVPEFLPRGKYKDDPIYGWKADYIKDSIQAIHFNSGVSIYFKSYAQKTANLQTGTVWVIWADEEMPQVL
jgi:hypothetical protein